MRLALCLSVLLAAAASTAAAQPDNRFVCGGGVEAEIWTSWDRGMSQYLLEHELQDRLLGSGDVYALYDAQTYMHNLAAMARRCDRQARLREMAKLLRVAYTALEPGSPLSPGRRWICRGGRICNTSNGLLGREVALDSAQFLGLASSVANALASVSSPPGEEEQAYLAETVQVAAEHLLRWGSPAAVDRIHRNAKALPQDVKDDSSSLFFSDNELWQIAIYAELAGVLQWQGRQSAGAVKLTEETRERMCRHLDALLNFFTARISYRRIPGRPIGNALAADLDRGYWRRHYTNRYAGYEERRQPVVCVPLGPDKTKFRLDVVVPGDSVRQRQDTGWDFSHARRLVHALDALDRNRDALVDVFSIPESRLPPRGLTAAFAANLVAAIWNGDAARPLFSNYWSGANGWYRVAYDNGTGECREGTPPYGLSEAFLTGGYLAWARFQPIIGALGATLYDITGNPDAEQAAFVARHYPSFAPTADGREHALARFMFLSSIVGIDNR